MTNPHEDSPQATETEQEVSANPEQVGGSTAASHKEDVAKLALADPDNDQIDRSIVIGNWLKHLSMWSLRLIIIAVAGYALWQMMGTLWGGLFPLILALIVCTVLAPMATALRRIGLPAAFAAIVSILSFFGVLGAVVWFIAPNIIGQSRVLYLQLFEGIQRLQLWAQGPPLNLDSSDLTQAVNDAVAWTQQRAGEIAGGVVTGISTATSWIITFFTVLVLSVFFLKDGHHFLPFLRGVMGRRAGWHATEVLTRSWETLGGYIRAQAIVSAIDAIVIGIGLYFIGVPMAFTLAVITFLAGFIPLVGAVAAGALAVIVALVSLGVTEALLALAVVIAVQQLEGNILSPLLQSRAMSLHPVIVLVSVVVGGGLFGLAGAFLAVPVAAVIAVVLRYLSEMTALQAGEKRADEIDFSTPEGRAIGRLSDEQGKRLRAQWREWEPLIDAPEKPAKKPAKKDFIERLLEAR